MGIAPRRLPLLAQTSEAYKSKKTTNSGRTRSRENLKIIIINDHEYSIRTWKLEPEASKLAVIPEFFF